MANEIVKYRNRLNEIPLRKFNVREMNLFFAIASRFTGKGTKKITFSFKKLKKLSHYDRHSERFVNELQRTYDKLIAINAYTDDGNTITKFTAFNEYQIKRREQTVTIAVNPKFKGLFNDLISSFTRFSLEEFARLKSTYSKTMFRFLKQFRTTGYLEFKMSEFRRSLDIPKSYRIDTIDRRILRPIKLELSPLFKNFAYEKLKEKGRGGKIVGYKFTWEPEAKDRNDFQDLETRYQEQLDNIKNNHFLKPSEKEASKKIIKKYYRKNSRNRLYTHPSLIQQKEVFSKIGRGKKLYKKSNDAAKRALEDYKNGNK